MALVIMVAAVTCLVKMVATLHYLLLLLMVEVAAEHGMAATSPETLMEMHQAVVVVVPTLAVRLAVLVELTEIAAETVVDHLAVVEVARLMPEATLVAAEAVPVGMDQILHRHLQQREAQMLLAAG